MIGVPDERYGEELMAWVIPRGGAVLDEEAVREFCRGKIAHYKIPRYVKFVDAFPMTVTGKVQKFKMRDQAIDELDLRPPNPPPSQWRLWWGAGSGGIVVMPGGSCAQTSTTVQGA